MEWQTLEVKAVYVASQWWISWASQRKASPLSQCGCMQPIKHPSRYLELLSSDCSGTAKSGKRVETRQILYVTDNADKLFISCEACISLGMIGENFPSISEAASLMTSSKEAICDCPRRTLQPPRPANPPCPPTEEKIPRIKQYLMDYYTAPAPLIHANTSPYPSSKALPGSWWLRRMRCL